MDSTTKINNLCKSVLKLTDEDFKSVQGMVDSQSEYIHPFKGAKQTRINSLGSYNARVLEAIKNLRRVLESH